MSVFIPLPPSWVLPHSPPCHSLLGHPWGLSWLDRVMKPLWSSKALGSHPPPPFPLLSTDFTGWWRKEGREGRKTFSKGLNCWSLWHWRRESGQSGWELPRGNEQEEGVGGRSGGSSLPLGQPMEWWSRLWKSRILRGGQGAYRGLWLL